MSDPKNENGAMSDKEAVSKLEGGEEATIIDVEPVEQPAGPGPEEKPKSSGLALRTKLIGVLVLLILVAGGVAAVLYPLWRDHAARMVADTGLPVSVPEVPDNGFYNTVSDVAGFLGGTTDAPESASAAAPTTPAPDPLEVMAGRLDALETQVGMLGQDLRAARTRADSASETAASLSDAIKELPAPDTAALESRIEALEGRMEALEARPLTSAASDGAGDTPVNAALLGTLGLLRERIAALEAKQTVTPLDLDALGDRIASAEDASAEKIAQLEAELANVRQLAEKRAPERERAGLLLLAVGQLEAATVTSGAFTGRLASVRDLAPGEDAAVSDAIVALQAHQQGVASHASLKERFDDVAKAVSQAKVAGSDEGFVGKTLNNIASLVTVRRTDVAEGPGVDAALVRAETALAADDLAGAVAALKTLSGPPAERAAPWLADAEARLAVDAAVAALRGAALASVAKAG